MRLMSRSKDTCGKRSRVDRLFLGAFFPLVSIVDMFDPIQCRYGHGVLRKPDPRFMALQQFCDARPELNLSPIIQMVKKVRV